MRASWKLQLTWRSCVATVLLCAAGALQAQTTDGAGDPPDRVARLSYVQGDVGLLPSGAQEWGEAGLNRPLTSGDKLSSGTDSRAELELDGAALRLDGQTDVGVLQLDDRLAQLELTQGTLNLTVRQLDDGQSYEIDTPTVALVVDHPGSYRVDVERDGRATDVTAFDGSATVYGENNAQRPVIAGRSYRFGDSSLSDVTLEDIGQGDDFDAWWGERDRRYADAGSRRYVSEDVIGYQDLDRYGQWRSDPDYGTVWYPAHVDVDWAPYREGHWAWVGPWGWTWIDDAPWGFAPYHYGRWAWRRDGWCWVPGPVGWRPVYAPALVAFVGGGGWSMSFGDAPVGWFPLGPGEVYDPWYHSSRRYYTQVNVTNIHVHNTVIVNRINRRYVDWRRGVAPPVRALHGGGARGFTAVPGRNFVGTDRVQRHRLQVDPARLANARLLAHGAAPRPTPHSLVAPRPPQARPLPAQGFGREVVARHEPHAMPGANRTAIAQPERELAGNVRVLRPNGGSLPAVAHIAPAAGSRLGPGALHQPPRLAGAADASRGDLPARAAPRVDPPRPGELRSASFVRGRVPIDAPRAQPRPGVSFVSSAQADRERAAGGAPRLPQVPRFQRADAPQAPPGRSGPTGEPRYRNAPDFDAEARAARIEAARQQTMQREAMMQRGDIGREPQPAHLRAPDFDAQLRARPQPQPQRFDRPPDFRAMRPMPDQAPVQREPAPVVRPAPHGAPVAPRREPPPRMDKQH
jgi:hypothetical protein